MWFSQRASKMTIVAMAFLVVAPCLLSGCASQRTVSLIPSLGPVDVSRPMVRYKPIQGFACGADSVVSALWDMKRLVGVDGYLEVVVEDEVRGKQRCTTATGYPFTYGTQPRQVFVRGNSSVPATTAVVATPAPVRAKRSGRTAAVSASRVAPTRAAAPTPRAITSALDCDATCARFSKLAGATSLIRRVVRDRCVSRCESGDGPYQKCISRARRAADVKACNAN